MASPESPLIIFDTTLRDGEQSPGASMTLDEKVRIAKALERLKVDVIEAGFAIASPGDFAAIEAVAKEIKESTVCSLARVIPKDIDHAANAIKAAPKQRIHTFIATSPIHMEHKLRLAPDEVIERAVKAIHHARKYVDDVEFSCEDAVRSEPDFLCRIIEQVIAAGAKTINIPDTVGYAIPERFGALIHDLLNRIPNADKAIFSVHCHNDLGLAVANSLAAVQNGARQVECTINGLGERAGNAALEEIVMATKTRHDVIPRSLNINTAEIVPTSRLVSTITGFPVQPNKAIVGANAFAHESGIHQDGVLKHRETYEIMQAEDVGWHTNRMVLGKHSGRNAFRSRLDDLGITFSDETTFNQAFEQFKQLADKKHDIFDEDLHALASDVQTHTRSAGYELIGLEVCSHTEKPPMATLSIRLENGEERLATSGGSGPVDAVFKAIENIANSQAALELYSVNAITEGTDSQGDVTVRLQKDGHLHQGQGADTDIIIASAKAYISALNHMAMRTPLSPQEGGV